MFTNLISLDVQKINYCYKKVININHLRKTFQINDSNYQSNILLICLNSKGNSVRKEE